MDMTTQASRPFVAAMQVTLDGYSLGPDGAADWVDSWADGLELLPRVDTFVLGGGMFPGYEAFWAAIRENPGAAAEWLRRDPYPREIEYASVAAETPHLVLSKTLDKVSWPTARIVRDLDELQALKAQPGGAVRRRWCRPGQELDRRGAARRASPDRSPGRGRGGRGAVRRDRPATRS